MKSKVGAFWCGIEPAWRWALGVYLVARVFYTLWSLVVLALAPIVVTNLDLYGTPVLAIFELGSGKRFLYSRDLGAGKILVLKPGGVGQATDQFGGIWTILPGESEGSAPTLPEAKVYTVEDVFPYRGVAPEQNPLLGVWQRFDTNWYLKIAQRGYAGDDGSTVYLPLYPLLVRVFRFILFGSYLLAALVISNVSLVLALYLLYRLTQEWVNDKTAKRATVYFMLFPTAFYFLAAYTESLFLALVLAAFYCARRNRWVWASALGMLATLTRLQGVLMVIPMAYMVWAQVGQYQWRWNKNVLRALLPLVLMPLALVGFLLFNNLTLLSSYEGELHARFVTPWENIAASLAVIYQGRASQADWLNIAATVLFGAMCIVVWRKLPRALGLYTVLMFLAPLLRMTTTQPLVSMVRYVAVLFPVFIVWGMWGRNRWVERAIVYPSIALSLYLSAQFFVWGWVA
ncbi:MAG: hypothetical protein HY741_28720 [Chloroflexi bacterium]|nr:hypothetical protein [Chloroflexota bacterium]